MIEQPRPIPSMAVCDRCGVRVEAKFREGFGHGYWGSPKE